MKYGIEFKIDVLNIDKEKLFKGKKGTYLTLKSFVNATESDQFGNNGIVTQNGEKGEYLPILGNAKVFWSDESKQTDNPDIPF